jgi:hypothetical protein
MAKKPKTKPPTTLPDEPIGLGPDGKILIVNADDPPFRPTVVDEDGNVVEIGDDD